MQETAKLLPLLNVTVAKAGATYTTTTGDELAFIPIPTPRWPDLLCTYDPQKKKLFSSKFFSAHANPLLIGKDPDSVCDLGGWDLYYGDWRHYFDCMLAPVAKQAAGKDATTLGKLMQGIALSRLWYVWCWWCRRNQQRGP